MIKKIAVLIALVVILIIGYQARDYSYASVPEPGEVADEYSFGWLGLSLVKDHFPVAWSGTAAYKKHDFEKINVDGIYSRDPNRPAFAIDKPWFDHPPLFGLITGGYAYFSGARDFKDVSVILLRRPMVKIGVLTVLLVFVLAKRLFGIEVGLVSTLLYAVVPTVVISSRLALAENGYLPLFLGSLIMADVYFVKKKRIYWLLAVFLSAVGILFKLSAISISLSLAGLALVYGKKDRKFLLVSAVLGAALALVVFGLYGYVFGWPTFVAVAVANGSRFYGAGAEVVLQLINQFKISTTKFLTDGWVLVGWISTLIIIFSEWRKTKGANYLTIAVFSYLSVFVIFGSESYGWYRFPFLPFLVIAAAYVLKSLFDRSQIFLASLLLMLPIGSSVHRLIGVVGFQQYAIYLRAATAAVVVVFGLSLIAKNKKINKFIKVLVLAVFLFAVWLSIREVYYYSLEHWYFVT